MKRGINETGCNNCRYSLWKYLGLAPPEYNGGGERAEKVRKEIWNAYIETLKVLKPFYAVICNGDMIDGRNDKSGGQELICIKAKDQIEIAEKCIKQLECDNLYFSAGTPYHVGQEQNFEEILAQRFNKEVEKILDLDFDGWQVNAKHHIGSSSIPHGRFTAGARAQLWNALKADGGNYPKSDIIIRSHCHYYTQARYSKKIMITTPCLQAPFTIFGNKCDGIVNLGFMYIDFEPKEDKKHIRQLPFVQEVNLDDLECLKVVAKKG